MCDFYMSKQIKWPHLQGYALRVFYCHLSRKIVDIILFPEEHKTLEI